MGRENQKKRPSASADRLITVRHGQEGFVLTEKGNFKGSRGVNGIMEEALVERRTREKNRISEGMIAFRASCCYMTMQQPLDCCGAYGSSRLSTVPHLEGTMKSFGSLSVKLMRSMAASDTGIRARFRSSFRRALSSVSLLSFSSAMLCFLLLPSPTLRASYGADIVRLQGAKRENARRQRQ